MTMRQTIKPGYDVLIMGGGPAGSTLAALLAQRSNLTVAVLEREVFPREHIGESFAHSVTPVLEQSGVLTKVLRSECWVRKYGGFYIWDQESPAVALFDHARWQQDGVLRWTFHVNRSEFDKILLDHARDCGVEVFEGVRVVDFEPNEGSGVVVRLRDGTRITGDFFVDASGRQNSLTTRKKRRWLSRFRNLAVWQHFTGCLPAQSIDHAWNVFHQENISPIAAFAFRDGWCWDIPVRKMVNGCRTQTHSLGIVTTPDVIKDPERDFTNPRIFLETLRAVPVLGGLLAEARPVGDKMHTATNYSMINDCFGDFGERWLLVGDSAFFVDPLFSSGVGFALAQASAAAMVIMCTADPAIPSAHKRDLWRDYDRGWHGMAESYALSIDQWYHAIGRSHPESSYWQIRGAGVGLDLRERTFHALLSSGMNPGLLQVLTRGTRSLSDLDSTGPYMRALHLADPGDPPESAWLALAPGVYCRESVGLEVPGFKALAHGDSPQYWLDPVRYHDVVRTPHARPIPCRRFGFCPLPAEEEVRSIDAEDGGTRMWSMLSRGPARYGDLIRGLPTPGASLLLKKLIRAGIVTANVVPASRRVTP
ncbi:NAD(P)/FAD-dependent oxidoreductase [Streptomyces sp. Lzd4kr]|nr:NAD(P)/FAD-dependent oxidoreductase [Streptomyces sp. Lzd4kr]